MITTAELQIFNIVFPIVVGFATFRWTSKLNKDQARQAFQFNRELALHDRKASAYSDLLASIEEMHEAKKSRNPKRRNDAETRMNGALAMIDVIAPKAVYTIASEAEFHADKSRSKKSRNDYLDKLTTKIREDLKTPDPKYSLEDE